MSEKPKDALLVAIDALAVELGIGNDGLAFTWDQMECVNRILAVHAHELADILRARAETIAGYDDAYRHAADFIDSEVTT